VSYHGKQYHPHLAIPSILAYTAGAWMMLGQTTTSNQLLMLDISTTTCAAIDIVLSLSLLYLPPSANEY